jgi:hypothetical protein
MLEEVCVHHPDEVVVQERIEEQVDYLLNAVPYRVNLYPPDTT